MDIKKELEILRVSYKSATKGPYHCDFGNSNIESENKDHYRATAAEAACILSRVEHYEHFDLDKSMSTEPRQDLDFLAQSANFVIKLLENPDILRMIP